MTAVLDLGRKPGSALSNRVVSKIHVDKEIGLTLYTRDGATAIKLGYGDYSDKYRRLRRVFSYLKTKDELKHLTRRKLQSMAKRPELLRGLYFRCCVSDFFG